MQTSMFLPSVYSLSHLIFLWHRPTWCYQSIRVKCLRSNSKSSCSTHDPENSLVPEMTYTTIIFNQHSFSLVCTTPRMGYLSLHEIPKAIPIPHQCYSTIWSRNLFIRISVILNCRPGFFLSQYHKIIISNSIKVT